jgi:hypothetical protein
MTDDNPDTRDPIAAAFEDYTPPPRDRVPKSPWRGDYDALFELDGQTVTATYYDRETDRPVTERIALTHPVFGKKG